MKAQKGRDILLKVKGVHPEDNFRSILGLRTNTLSLNTEIVDISHANSDGWRELLDDAGLSQASISGGGIFLNTDLARELKSIFFRGDIRQWAFFLPGFGQIEGPFQVTNLDYQGEYKGEISVSITLESAGVLIFTELDSELNEV